MTARQHARSRALLVPLCAVALLLMNRPPVLAAESASAESLPLRHATFELRNEVKVKVPEGAKRVRVWMALPQEEEAQQVSDMRVEAPSPWRIGRDSEGSRVLYLETENPPAGEFTLATSFVVTRREVRHSIDPGKARPISDVDRVRFAEYLRPNKYVVIDDEIRRLADQIVGSETNPVLAARKIYSWVLDNVDYWVKDPEHKKASPVGSTTYCLTLRTGNCTDFESLWTSLARAKGIPTQIVYGSFLKPELRDRDEDQSYHCWAMFYAPGLGWVPHDVAVADLYKADIPITPANAKLVRLTTSDGTFGADPAKVNYYFGNLDERRVVWSRNRDLTLDPKQDGEPVNALPKAYVEVDGKVLPETTGWVRKLTYKERQ
jgi:transglutaminase-like putative cysteine protease